MKINDNQLSNIILASFFAGIAAMALGITLVIGDIPGVIISVISLILLVSGWFMILKDVLKTG